MTPTPKSIIDAAIAIGAKVPPDMVENVAGIIETRQGSELRSKIADALPHAEYRDWVMRFLDEWDAEEARISPQQVATALQTAAQFQRLREATQSVEMVWTGPDSDAVAYRHTEQAILQVLNSAKEKVLLVSYAVYAIPNIRDAVVRAAQRGVKITVIVETPSETDVKNEYSTLRALGQDVAACSKLFYWPKANRTEDEKGRLGILHVKCLVADGRMLFLSSANLTKYAFTQNMELGLLITGGRMPSQIESHFHHLIDERIFREVESRE